MRSWVFLKAKSSEFAVVGSADVVKVLNVRVMAPLSWLALIIGACLVGSAVVVGFGYRGLPCTNGCL